MSEFTKEVSDTVLTISSHAVSALQAIQAITAIGGWPAKEALEGLHAVLASLLDGKSPDPKADVAAAIEHLRSYLKSANAMADAALDAKFPTGE